jgi:hypothetical protein
MPFTAKLYDDLPDAPVSRSRTHFPASVDSHTHHVIIHNLSSEGLLIESHDDLEIGAEVTLDISDLGRHVAHVIWRDGVFYDCQFASAIPAARVRRKLHSAKVVWAPFAADRATLAQPRIESAAQANSGLSSRARLAVILSAALLCWAIPAALIYALIW